MSQADKPQMGDGPEPDDAPPAKPPTPGDRATGAPKPASPQDDDPEIEKTEEQPS
ncbi:hypothetical protein [Methylobacterium trifolii]|uniref:Uncharacterized protein n=1 Tax=Methylobacterium trifolii TaxID=1003092 RepID=A0ABQ4TUE4_9HYPH|nr:hypothetical protein [Methylobacterium trifolii]GJE58308.1 hypothetical protein MPOCJGCO_0387 [Methylobacterium trifolii]